MFILFTLFAQKSHIWEKSVFGDIGQNVPGQSDCRIFESTVSLA